MAAWWCWPLPAWLGSSAAWFVLLNVVVGAIFALSSRPQPPSPSSSASPRRRGVTRRASSVLLQRIRSFSSIFSFPSYNSQETEEITTPRRTPRRRPSTTPRAAVAVASAPPAAAAAEGDDIDEDEGDANAMSMDEVYALVLAGRQQQRPPTEEETARYEVDAKAEEFKEDLRQQRLRSIFNYTQMLKQRAAAAARRPPVTAAPPDTTNQSINH